MPDPETTPTTSKSNNTLVAVLITVTIGAGAILLWLRSSGQTRPTENSAGGYTLALETFVVNLNGEGERAYLRVGISLGLSRPPANKEQLPNAIVRDTILSVLSLAHSDQLMKPEGKGRLKADILQALQNRVPQLGVVDVYFTEFLVQM